MRTELVIDSNQLHRPRKQVLLITTPIRDRSGSGKSSVFVSFRGLPKIIQSANAIYSMDAFSDNELIKAYREGQEAALSFLITRYLTPVYRFLYRLVGDVAAAEDLTQETFLKVWKSLSKFQIQRSFKAWLFSIARNTAIDHLRKKQALTFSQLENEDLPDVAEMIVDREPLVSELLEQRETAERLQEALEQLSFSSKTVVLMHEAEDMTFQEIADVLKEPMNTVKSRYRRALVILKNLLVSRWGKPTKNA